MKIGLLAMVLLLFSCATDRPENKIQTQPLIQSKLQEGASKPLTGNLFFINVDKKKLDNELSKDLADFVVKSTEQFFTEKGFKSVTNSSKAHLIVHLLHDRFIFDQGRFIPWTKEHEGLSPQTITKTTATIRNGKIQKKNREIISSFFQRLAIAPVVQEYGKRQVTLDVIVFEYRGKDWTKVKDELTSSFMKELAMLQIDPPAENLKTPGDPGCLPRFGFDLVEETATVRKVQANSPASKAGIRIGDVILAVDSQSYKDYDQRPDLDEVYEKSIEVPIKFKRGEKIFRRSIKSKILCHNY